MFATFTSRDISMADRVGQIVQIDMALSHERDDGRFGYHATFSDGYVAHVWDSEIDIHNDPQPDTFACASVQMEDVSESVLAGEFVPDLDGFDMAHTIPVRVFRNLTAGKQKGANGRGCVSIQTKINGTWRTVAHADEVELASVRFHVSEAGRQRVIRERKKSVHAWVEGGLIAASNVRVRPAAAESSRVLDVLRMASMWVPECDGLPVTYNPFRDATFVMRHDRTPVRSARHATVSPMGAVAA